MIREDWSGIKNIILLSFVVLSQEQTRIPEPGPDGNKMRRSYLPNV